MRDKRRVFRYGSLQGESARSTLPAQVVNGLTSIVLRFPDGRLLTESDAVIQIVSRIPGYQGWARIFQLAPRFLRNIFYRLVSRSRYSVFGKRDSCRLPTPEDQSLFLP